jgi:hypothetical protein
MARIATSSALSVVVGAAGAATTAGAAATGGDVGVAVSARACSSECASGPLN